jgi:Tol biopolymer transport system component
MPDQRSRLRSLDRLDPPDLWGEIDGRDPGSPVSLAPSPLRRAGTALAALAVAAAAVTFAVVALDPGADPEPAATTPGASSEPPAPRGFTNGAMVVFAAPGRDKPVQLFRIDAGDGAPVQITSIDGTVASAAVSADGSLIAYAVVMGDRVDIHTVRIDGSDDSLVCRGCGSASAYSSSAGEGGISIGEDVTDFAVLSDGTVRSARLFGGVEIREGERILARSPEGRGVSDWDVDLAPDGSVAVWRRSHPGAAGVAGDPSLDGLYLLDATTGEVRRITTQEGPPFTHGPDSEPEWSPDGEWIVFTRRLGIFKDEDQLQDGDHSEIWLVRPDGSEMHPVTDTEGPGAVSPAWSPDGSRIAYIVLGASGSEKEIRVIDIDGSNPLAVLDCKPEGETGPVPLCPLQGSLSWSPDGTKLLFDTARGTTVLDIEQGIPRQVTEQLRHTCCAIWQPLPPEG